MAFVVLGASVTGMELEDVPFTFDVELKAVGTQVVEELGDGDLLIEGWGATLDIDREDEAFTDGAFTKGLKKFLSGGAPLCWHHQYDKVIGKIVHAERIPGRGVWVKAIVDRQPETSPLYPHYQAIKKGRANGLSVGGIFKRTQTPNGPRIHDVDIMEWSATATPIGSTATFKVIAGKALEFKAGEGEELVTNSENEVVTEVVAVEPETAPVAEPTADEKPVAEMTDDEKEALVGELNQRLLESPELQAKIKEFSQLEPGSITTEHLSDELRSRFAEWDPSAPTMDDLNTALTDLSEKMAQVFDKIGMGADGTSGSEAVTAPVRVL